MKSSTTLPSRLLTEKLLQRGYTLRVIPTTPSYREFTAPSGKRWLTPTAAFLSPFVTAVAQRMTKNKAVCNQLAAMLDIPVPRTVQLPAAQPELPALVRDYAPLAVKPLDSDGARGLTLDVTDYQQLVAAIGRAEAVSPKVLVQQQFSGHEIRLTVIHGKVVHGLLRQPPQVIGDGISAISQLIERENAARALFGFKHVPYPQLTTAMLATPAMLQSSQVPAQAEVIQLSKSVQTAGGASMLEITDQIDASYKRTAERLANAINPDFMVVDLMAKDYTVPASPNNYIFLECNTTPSLRLYYDVRSGTDFDIAGELAAMMDEWSQI